MWRASCTKSCRTISRRRSSSSSGRRRRGAFQGVLRKPIMEKVSSSIDAFLEDSSVPDVGMQSWVVSCKSCHKGSGAGVRPFASVSGVCRHPWPDFVWCPMVGRNFLFINKGDESECYVECASTYKWGPFLALNIHSRSLLSLVMQIFESIE
jgi:hypothetical protein